MWSTLLEGGPVATVLILLISVFVLVLVRRKKRLNLPPGPRGLPVIGYLPFLSLETPHLQLDEIRKKYGNVFGMYMGSKYFLILCDLQSTKEAFNRDEYTLRPEGRFQISEDFSTFGFTHGQHWTDHRKLAIRALRQLGLYSPSLQEEITKQITLSLELLEKQRKESSDGEMSLREVTSKAVVTMTCAMICGKTYPFDHEVTKMFLRYLQEFNEFATAFSIDTFFQWLKPISHYFVPDKVSMKKTFKEMENFLWSEIDFHEKHSVDEPNDFLDYYLEERSKPNMENRFTRPDLNGDAQMLLFAAGDMTRASIEWFLLCMAKYGEIQDKVYKEILDRFGSSSLPDYSQREKTPFAEASILESMRYRTLQPINPIHGSTNQVTSFQGYDIPAESVVTSCLWSIHNDPKNWDNPDTFDPNRFLSDNGMTVIIPDCFIPFGTGKRICIGSKLAFKEMYLFCLSVLQRFQVLPPIGGVNVNGKMRLSWEPVSPIVRLVPRVD